MRGRTGVFAAVMLLTTTSFPAYADDSGAPSPTGAEAPAAETPSGAAMAADVLVVRPLALAATAVGCVLFIADVPFMPFQAGSPGAPFRRLVAEPARFAFSRPLGAGSD